MDNSSREKNHFQIVVVREILGPIVCILFSSQILKEKMFLATFFNVIKIKMLYMTIFQLHVTLLVAWDKLQKIKSTKANVSANVTPFP